MIPVLTPTEMAAADAAAPVAVEVLVERAGAAVAREALDLLGGAYGRRVVVVAGKGNNGADGLAAARILRRRGARVETIDALSAPASLPPAHLVIDAAYGTGFHGSYEAPAAGDMPVLAVDIPSGLSGTTGEVGGSVLRATRTVTFAALKPGLLLGSGPELAGQVVVADIGLPVTSSTGVVEASDVRNWMPRRGADGHKWDAAVLVIAGGPGMTGAGYLAAAGAQRAGAGMVRLGAPGTTSTASGPIEAVRINLGEEGWEQSLDEVSRFGALVIGPGLGRSAVIAASVCTLLASADVPAVIDADALVALGDDLDPARRTRAADSVLTPHAGEYAVVMGEAVGVDRLASARRLAARSGSVALLKGSTTVIARPDGDTRIVTTGDARLATAGTGDVLSGLVGALLARGMSAFDAASAGAWLHGRAGQLGHAHGLIASDLLALLPVALDEVKP